MILMHSSIGKAVQALMHKMGNSHPCFSRQCASGSSCA
jgi:hypothetical protein